MRKLFTFIGTGQYQPVVYTLGTRREKNAHFPLVLGHWLQPDKILFFLTADAEKSSNWLEVRRTLEDEETAHEIVRIPDGRTDAELWEIFDALTRSADAGDTVSIDVTHGFRSLPFLGFIAAAFLRRAKGFSIDGLYYGAYDARELETNVAPVFELTPFLDLLDWLASTERFLTSGDGRQLASHLRKIQAAHAGSGQTPPEHLRFGAIARPLEDLSEALLVNCPREVPTACGALFKAVGEMESHLAEGPARVFATLLDRVRNTYASLEEDSLVAQLRIARWYFDNGHVVHAATLARECLVGMLCHLLAMDPAKDSDRAGAEEVLNHLVFKHCGELQGEPAPRLSDLEMSPHADQFLSIWGKTRVVRNNMAHCGFKEQPIKAAKLKHKTGVILDETERLFESLAAPTEAPSSDAPV